MPIISTSTIYSPDGRSETLDAHQALYRTQMQPQEWSMTPPPPLNWDREIPMYKVARDLRPAPRARYRTEPPFTSISDNDCYQYAERPLVAGEIISTTQWPHESFIALSYSAERVLQFFRASMKSRLPRSPWRGDRIVLADGISGALPFDVRAAPKPAPVNLRPAA
jgi:hypothetical protein